MNRVAAIAQNTFREAVRNKILYSVLFFSFALVFLAALFGSVTIGDRVKVMKDFSLFALSLCGAMTTIIAGTNLLQKEIKQKTVYQILSKPVSRWEFILGKYFGLVATSAMIVFLMGGGILLILAGFEGAFDRRIFEAILLTVLEMSLLSGVVLFFSSIVVTTTLTGLFSFATYLAGHSLGYLSYFLQGEGQAGKTLASVIWFTSKVLPDLQLFNQADKLVYGQSIPLADWPMLTIYTIAYSGVLLTLGCLIFNKRELN